MTWRRRASCGVDSLIRGAVDSGDIIICGDDRLMRVGKKGEYQLSAWAKSLPDRDRRGGVTIAFERVQIRVTRTSSVSPSILV